MHTFEKTCCITTHYEFWDNTGLFFCFPLEKNKKNILLEGGFISSLLPPCLNNRPLKSTAEPFLMSFENNYLSLEVKKRVTKLPPVPPDLEKAVRN